MAEPLHLVIRQPSGLLSKVFESDITEEQARAIRVVAEDPKLAFNILEDIRVRALIIEDYPNIARTFGEPPLSESELRALHGDR